MIVRRVLLAISAASFVAGVARGQTWPTRTVRLIVPVPPGGSVDALARLLGRHLTESLGQPVVIENHGGAGGNIAFELVANARPDGHTILVGWDSVAINPALYRNLGYDPIASFAPVIQTVRGAQVLAVRNDLPARDLNELLALGRRGAVSVGTPGNGSIGHLALELIKSRSGVPLTHVPYRGGGPALTDLIAGHIDAVSLTLAAAMPHARAGRLRPIAVSTAVRDAALPDVPTVLESGIAGYDVVSWQGLLAPAGTDPAVIARLNREVAAVLASPDVLRWLASQAFTPVGGEPGVLATLLAADVARWPAVVAAAGMRLD